MVVADVDGPGADGLAFVMAAALPDVAQTPGGSGLGYQGITPSVVVEIDTFKNVAVQDISGNHVGINLNGNLQSVVQKNVVPLFNNGSAWHCWVDYDAANVVLEVRLSMNSLKPATPTISYYDSVVRILGTYRMYIGLTAATGQAYSHPHHPLVGL